MGKGFLAALTGWDLMGKMKKNLSPPHHSLETLSDLPQLGKFTSKASFVKDQNKRKRLAQREAGKEFKLPLIFHHLPSPAPILAAPVFCFVSLR